MLSDFGLLYAANGLIGRLFAATAPVAIILAVGSSGGLSEAEIASWIFGVFFINGLITIAVQLALPPTAGLLLDHSRHGPGRPSLGHLTFQQVVGAFYRHRAADARARR